MLNLKEQVLNRKPPGWQMEKIRLAEMIVESNDEIITELKSLNEKLEEIKNILKGFQYEEAVTS